MNGYFGSYAQLGVLTLVGAAFVAVSLAASRLLRPAVPAPEKTLTYECGVDPTGDGWDQSYVRYYIYAFLYVVFAADGLFLFPWATVFAAPGFGGATLAEMFVFLGFVFAGVVYAWKKGVLEWA
jgi:NADH-quinone oxidoreductase subunit A